MKLKSSSIHQPDGKVDGILNSHSQPSEAQKLKCSSGSARRNTKKIVENNKVPMKDSKFLLPYHAVKDNQID